MTFNNFHQRIGTTASKNKDSLDDGGRLVIMYSVSSKVVPAKDFEGVIEKDGNFLEEITYKQLDAMSTIVTNYKIVVK